MIEHRLDPQPGTAFELMKGQLLRVIDLEGEHVADMVAFNCRDKPEWLSSRRGIDYANRIYLSTGHTLYSNRSRPMFAIIAESRALRDLARFHSDLV